MTEAVVQRGLLKALRLAFPSFVIFKHSEVLFSGVPDISVNGNNVTSWLEVKLAKPTLKSKGIQSLNMSRLSRNGHAYYVVYTERAGIVAETAILYPGDHSVVWSTPGIDHAMVVSFIRRIHAVPI